MKILRMFNLFYTRKLQTNSQFRKFSIWCYEIDLNDFDPKGFCKLQIKQI